MRARGVAAAAVAALSASTEARNMIPAPVPRATTAVDFSMDGWTPKPTPPPGGLDLLRRQLDDDDDDEGTTALIAPDNTCGFVSGRPGVPYSCGIGVSCVFFTPTSVFSGYVGCCNAQTCGIRLDCIDYDSYYTSSACTAGCEMDFFTVKCTDTSRPYCNTISFSSNIYDYWCNSLSNSRVQSATTAYSGDSRSFSDLVLSNPTESPTPTPTDTDTDTDTAITDPTSPPTDTSDSGDQDDDDDDDNDNDNGGSSTPVGPIVGGVVGGVGAIALGVLGVWLFIRNKNKKKAAAAAAAAAPPPAPQYAPPMAGVPGQPPYNPNQSYYDPKFAAAASQQSYSPQQQQQQQQQQQPGGFYPMTGSPPPPPASTGSPTMSYADPSNSGMPSPSAVYPSGVPSSQSPPPPSQTQGFVHEAPSRPDETHRGGVHELG